MTVSEQNSIVVMQSRFLGYGLTIYKKFGIADWFNLHHPFVVCNRGVLRLDATN